METEAVFNRIGDRIRYEISKAKSSIYIAVAWFTNKFIFNELVKKAKEGCQVHLIIYDDLINNRSLIDFNQLNIQSSKAFKVGDGDTRLMHNKFCVIDASIVITGSYNWSYKAENNFENIILTKNNTPLAEQFILEFARIKSIYYPSKSNLNGNFPVNQTIKRLEIIKNYIQLNEIGELKRSLSRLQQFEFNSEIDTIIHLITIQDYEEAINEIQRFISKNSWISVWNDPEIPPLKLQIKVLEIHINALDNEKFDMEKIIAEFQQRQSMELGGIMLDILSLRKIIFKYDRRKFEEAENDETQYRDQLKSRDIFLNLNPDERANLKRRYREATMLCHPDKFANESIELQNRAEAIFKKLNEANTKNNIQLVSEILETLKNGVLSTPDEDKISDKEVLEATIVKLKVKLQQLESEILEIKESEDFCTIRSINDWDTYFRETKIELQSELENLQKQANFEF